jgi:integrase
MAAHFLQKSRHKSVYYFRRRIPDDLRLHTARRQIFRSLHTGDRREALIRARALAVEADSLFRELRAMAKNRSGVRTDYKMDFKLDEFGRVTDVSVDAETHEQDAVNSALATVLAGSGGAKAIGTTAADDSPSPIVSEASTRPSENCGTTLSGAIAKYQESGGLKPTTARRYAPVLERVKAFFGAATPLAEITQSRFAKYAASIKGGSHAPKTMGLYIGTAGAFFNWCGSHFDDAPQISTRSLKPKRLAPARDDRAVFSTQELRCLVEAVAPVRASEPHKYWITVLGIFTGARLEELAQLGLENVKKDEASDFWFLDINGHDGRSLKTKASWRLVPLHPAVISSGLAQYVDHVRAAGHSRLFPQWKPRTDPKHGGLIYGHKISRWGGEQLALLRKHDQVTTPKTTYFHSMRHTLVNHLKQAMVDENLRAAIVGHEIGGINQNHYGKQYGVALLGGAMVKAMHLYADLLQQHEN